MNLKKFTKETRMKLGRLEKIDLRDVWKPKHRTSPLCWQEENLALLGETINLIRTEAEQAGLFRADILCRETDGNSLMLVENQVERMDHTHLGQLLTYAAGLNTVTIVWIAKRFTDEHRVSLDWLNEITGEEVNFFGLGELWRIGQSNIAPKFNMVSKLTNGPKGKAVVLLSKDTDLTLAKILQLEYWNAFRDYVLEHSTVMSAKAWPCHWMNFGIGKSKSWPRLIG